MPDPTINTLSAAATIQLPVLERIRQQILSTLAGITTANGFNCDCIVDEPGRLGEDGTDGKVVVLTLHLGVAEHNPEVQGNQLVEWAQEFLVEFDCSQLQSAEASVDQLMIIVKCDIEKALDADPHRGGLAGNTRLAPPDWFHRAAGEHEGGVARRYVIYRHQYGNPYLLRT